MNNQGVNNMTDACLGQVMRLIFFMAVYCSYVPAHDTKRLNIDMF